MNYDSKRFVNRLERFYSQLDDFHPCYNIESVRSNIIISSKRGVVTNKVKGCSQLERIIVEYKVVLI